MADWTAVCDELGLPADVADVLDDDDVSSFEELAAITAKQLKEMGIKSTHATKLLKHCKKSEMLWAAASNGELEAIERLVSSKVDVNKVHLVSLSSSESFPFHPPREPLSPVAGGILPPWGYGRGA